MSETGNLFSNRPTSLPEEVVEILAETDSVRIERIVSTGQSSPEGFWYDQDEHEFVVVLKGEATLLSEPDGESLVKEVLRTLRQFHPLVDFVNN